VSATTSGKGEYRIEVPTSTGQPYVSIYATAAGHRPLANVLTAIAPGETSVAPFELLPLDPTPEQVTLIEQRHEQAKAQLYERLRTLDEGNDIGQSLDRRSFAGKSHALRGKHRHATRQAAAATYFVPSEVFVSSLPQSGFTGFIDFDEYIGGVVAAEMGDTFPFEALKAQAIASRTYALERYERTGIANGGQAYSAFFSPMGESAVAATNTTGGVLLYQGQPFTAFFSARCNGDFTLDSEDGLSCIPGGCANPCEVGGLLPLADPLPYARSRPCSGHVNCSMTSEACCVVSIDARVEYIYGHGVGMCQRGAQQFACRDGRDASAILDGFYTDVVLANDPGLGLGDRVTTTADVNARAAPCATDRVVVPSGTPGTVVAGPSISHCNDLGVCVGDVGTYWTWWQVDFDGGPSSRWLVEDYLVAGAPACAAPVSSASPPTATDCLFILRAATGLETCDPACICAPTGSPPPTATDALLCLRSATGLAAPLACPC
jgi:hypothetical protein